MENLQQPELHLQRLKERKLPAEVRFWKRVNKEGPECGDLGCCWDWIGSTKHNPYGVIGVGSKFVKCHQFSWTLANGPIPEGVCVLHKCDRMQCVNPAHLYLGTQQDNIADMSKRNRIPLGEEKVQAKLTEEIVRTIRKEFRPFSRVSGAAALGRRFGVTGVTVQAIVHGRKWSHVQ